jgi:hypothetical protein
MTALPAKTAFTAENLTEGDFRAAMDNLRDYLSERVQGLKSNTALSDAAATLTAAQLVGGEFTITPTVARTQTTDTAVNIIAAMAGSADGSSFEFTVVNLADFAVTIALGTGVTLVGDMAINIGAATFRVRRLTSTTVSVTRLESQFTAADNTKLDSLGSQNVKLNTKLIDIGDWNMNTTYEFEVTHGLTLNKIRGMSVLIRNDADTNYTLLAINGVTACYADATEITLNRVNSGAFDTSFYESPPSGNRGWITIQYVD